MALARVYKTINSAPLSRCTTSTLCASQLSVGGRYSLARNISLRVQPNPQIIPTMIGTQHYTKGSKVPDYTGTLRVYSMRFCPYAQRTILALNAKKLDYEVVNVNLTTKPEWLTSKSPLGKVPALEVEKDVTIYESLITAEYIEDKYPQPPLVSKDPLRKAQDKIIVENFNKAITSYYKVIFKSDDPMEGILKSYMAGLQEVESEITKRGTKFLAGTTPGMVDYMIWPWFERFGLVPKYSGRQDCEINQDRFPQLSGWIEAMKEDPVVRTHYLEMDVHDRFFQGRLNGTGDYDFLSQA